MAATVAAPARQAAARARSHQMGVLLVAVFAVMLGYGVTLTVLPYYTTRVHRFSGISHDALAVHIGVLTGVYALAQLVGGPFIGRLTDRWGRRPVAVAGLTAVGATQIAFGMVTGRPSRSRA